MLAELSCSPSVFHSDEQLQEQTGSPILGKWTCDYTHIGAWEVEGYKIQMGKWSVEILPLQDTGKLKLELTDQRHVGTGHFLFLVQGDRSLPKTLIHASSALIPDVG